MRPQPVSSKQLTVTGMMLSWAGLFPASIVIDNGQIVEIGAPAAKADYEATILPGLVNGHTHMGDAFIGEAPHGLSLSEMVAPPHGYKHVRLAAASSDVKLQGMIAYLQKAWRLGISVIHDFREEGVAGVRLAREAARQAGVDVAAILYGRRGSTEDSCADAVREGDGLGISALSDVPAEECRRWSDIAHAAGKPVALHVSEQRRENMADALTLRPAFLVHLCKATAADLEMMATARVPAVFCPRSNARFGLTPPAKLANEAGIPFALGSDNAMLASPDLFAEAHLLGRMFEALPPLAIARGAFLGGQVLSPHGGIAVGQPADLVLCKPVSRIADLFVPDGNLLVYGRIHGSRVTLFANH